MIAHNIIPFPSSPQVILKRIRELAGDSSRIRLSPNIQTDFTTGHITFRQILNCLRQGAISLGPYPDDLGLTCCELEWISAGRVVRVVVSIEGSAPDQRVLHILFAEEF